MGRPLADLLQEADDIFRKVRNCRPAGERGRIAMPTQVAGDQPKLVLQSFDLQHPVLAAGSQPMQHQH